MTQSTPDVGPERRLFGMMQGLLSARAGNPPPWTHSGPRDLVSKDDAAEAILFVTAVLDSMAQGAALPPDRLIAAMAMLALAREYVEPLPIPPSERGDDAVADDLRGLLEDVRRSIEES